MASNKVVDLQVAKAIRSLLRNQPAQRINQLAEAYPNRNVRPPQRESSPTPTINRGGGDLAARMGFIRAPNKPLRSQLSLCDIASQRSDAIPGRWSCIECGRTMGSLQEAWRKGGDVLSNFSTLFCAPCALKLNQSANLGLSPIELNNFDKLNTGQFVEAFGVAAPAQAAEAPKESKLSKWQKLLD